MQLVGKGAIVCLITIPIEVINIIKFLIGQNSTPTCISTIINFNMSDIWQTVPDS